MGLDMYGNDHKNSKHFKTHGLIRDIKNQNCQEQNISILNMFTLLSLPFLKSHSAYFFTRFGNQCHHIGATPRREVASCRLVSASMFVSDRSRREG